MSPMGLFPLETRSVISPTPETSRSLKDTGRELGMVAHAYNPRILEMGYKDQFKVILSYTLHSKFKACLGYLRPEGEKEQTEGEKGVRWYLLLIPALGW